MNKNQYVLAMVVIVVFFSLSIRFPLAAEDRDKPELTEEPPLEYILMYNGKEVPFNLNTPFEVKTNSGKTEMKVIVRPYREFILNDLQFRYPRKYMFECDMKSAKTTHWTLEGKNNTLMVLRFSEDLEPDSAQSDIVNSVIQKYGKTNVEKKSSEITLDGRTYEGTKIKANITKTKTFISQELYSFRTNLHTYLLVIQDSLTDAGGQTEETKNAKKLLKESFRFREHQDQ